MAIEVVFFDIDGTLIDENKKTADKAIEAIKSLRETGVKVIFATGRSPQHIVDMQQMFDIESYVCFNGSIGLYEGEHVFQHYLNRTNLTKLKTEANQNEHPMVFLNDQGTYANLRNDNRIEASFQHLKEKLPLYEPTIWNDDSFFQGFLYCSPEEQEIYRKNHPELRFTRWHQYAVDINNYNMNKSVGIESMLKHLNVDRKNVAAFGDNLNDLEMLSYVGQGIAMGNAVPEAKSKADYVTKPLHENGIYYGLKYLELI